MMDVHNYRYSQRWILSPYYYICLYLVRLPALMPDCLPAPDAGLFTGSHAGLFTGSHDDWLPAPDSGLATDSEGRAGRIHFTYTSRRVEGTEGTMARFFNSAGMSTVSPLRRGTIPPGQLIPASPSTHM